MEKKEKGAKIVKMSDYPKKNWVDKALKEAEKQRQELIRQILKRTPSF